MQQKRASARAQKITAPTIATPAIVAVDSFEGGDVRLVWDVGAGKCVGLVVLLESDNLILVREEVEEAEDDDDTELVGKGNEEVRLMVAIVDIPFEYI
jgi:hypothetical protein